MKSASYISELSEAGLIIPRPTSAASLAATLLNRGSDFFQLTKPRMNVLVVATTFVGYFMAVRGHIFWGHVAETMLGTALTAAAASVLNQHLERRFDALMPRTANRPAAAGRIKPVESLTFGLVLAILGLCELAIRINPLTAVIGALTLGSYVLVYTPLKRYTTLNTVIGAIPGALPPVMGWTAVRSDLAPEALVLFSIIFLWQMPHFLAIATLYRDDYAAGGYRMLPVVDDNLKSTVRQVILYTLALLPVSFLPSILPGPLRMAGFPYFIGALILGGMFLYYGLVFAANRAKSACHRPDARRLFLVSIIYLPVLFMLLMLDRIP